jgi:hypothetical protein
MVDYPFMINYDEILRADGLLECTRDLARSLKHNPYISMGDYMNEMPSKLLDKLLHIADNEDNDHFDELLLHSEMLARAEGLEAAESLEDSLLRLKMYMSILAVEGLSRKGLVKAYRENYSLGEDMMSKTIAKRIDGIDYNDDAL